MARPKGSKSIGVPPISIKEAVDLVKTAFGKIGYNESSFKEMAAACGQPAGNAIKIFGHIDKQFGLLGKTPQGLWKITDLGRRVAKGEKAAIKEAFERNLIYKDLSHNFFGRNVTVGAVETYLRANYKQGENTPYIAKKFIEAKEYLKSLNIAENNTEKLNEDIENNSTLPAVIKLFQLKYALNPPEKEEISKIVESLQDEKGLQDDTLKALINQMISNKDKEEVLKVLTQTLFVIVSKKYGIDFSEEEK
ncbi:Uncharacterised protein [uncultured archaeon]|nr:Uncharacterised protein [uncultured archaeon]